MVVFERYACFGILKDLASLRHHAKNTYVPLFQLNLNQDFTGMTTLFTVKNLIVSLFVPLIYKYVRQVIQFKSKTNVSVSGSSARLAHVPDNTFITVCQQTLLAEWAACCGSSQWYHWVDGPKQPWYGYGIWGVTRQYFNSYIWNRNIYVH